MADEMMPAETPPGRSADNSKMARAAAGISAFTVLGFCTGPITKIILARVLGTEEPANAFNYVNRLTQDVFRSWEKLVRPTFLPVLAQERERVGAPAAWRFANSVVNLQAVALALLTAALMVFSREVIRTTNLTGVQATLAARFLVVLAPSVFFLSIAVTLYMLLNSYKRFHLAAFGDQVFAKLVPLLALVLLYAFAGLYALLFGIVVGALAKLALYVWGLRAELRNFRLELDLRSVAMKHLWLMILPLAAGVLVAFFRNRGEDLLLSAVLGGRAMTIVIYARAPVDIPIQIFPAALSIAIFPFISEYFARKNYDELFAVLGKGIRIIFLAFLPLTVALLILAHPLTAAAFRGGKYTADDVLLTTTALRWYAIAYVFLGLELLLLQFFYAARETWTPTWTGIMTSLVQLLILSELIIRAGDDVGAFTLAFSASKALKVALLFVLLVRFYPHSHLWTSMLRRTVPALVRIAIATAAMGAVVYVLHAALEKPLPPTHFLTAAGHLVVAGGAGALVFAAGVHLLGVEEWRQGLDWVKGKLVKR
jgi:putative peptidoglycan lipid II flippase